MIETLTRAVLLADSSITGLIGAGAAARLYPLVLKQGGALPAITYQRVSGVTGYSHDGPDIVTARVQIDCWSATGYIEAKTLARAVRDALHAYAGDENGVQDFKADIDRDFYESDTKLYRVSSDYLAYARDQAA